MSDRPVEKKKSGGVLGLVEKIGNKIPDPVMIFVWLCIILMILSAVFAGVTVIHPGTGEEVVATSLLTVASLRKILTSVPTNFTSFAPLGAVLTIMLGCGVAEKSGWLIALIRKMGSRASKRTVTVIVVFVGIMANQAGDAGWIVLPPLAAMLFHAVGRNPILGLLCAFASVSTGMAANLLPSMSDVLAGAFTIQAAQFIDPNFEGNIAMNMYFLIVSTFLLTIAGTFVTERVVDRRLGAYTGDVVLEHDQELSTQESKAMFGANMTFLALCVVLVILCLGDNAFMRDPVTGSLITSGAPLMGGIITIVAVIFFIPAVVYGVFVGTIKGSRGVVGMMSESMRDMGGYIVLAFVAAQFSSWFTQSNLSTVLAVKGADVLKNMGAEGVGLLVGMFIVSCILNLFIGSASAKWALLAPIFVPMFMLLGIHPAATQAAYRVGDAATNAISPLFPYMTILLAYCKKYDKNFGFGTMLANMIPYSVVMGLCWILLLVIWWFTGLPLGPQGPLTYTVG